MNVNGDVVRIEYADDKIDAYGRRAFTLYWNTNYTPSKPYPHERAQVFFADPAKYIDAARVGRHLDT